MVVNHENKKMNPEQNLNELRSQQQLLLDWRPKTKKDIGKRTKQLRSLDQQIKALEFYLHIQEGWGVNKQGRFGMIVEKFITGGGMPQLWVTWGDSELPYPELPLIMTEVYEACPINPDSLR